jgi:steroid delta-isomerase-like uncharacterized protein
MAQPAVQSIVDTAKAPTLAYNKKDWNAVKAAMTPNCVYDEVATQKAQGVENILTIWQGWAAALPDSAATFHSALTSGNSVVIEVTWRGTHTGALRLPHREIAPTGKKIELRACQVVEVSGDKVQTIRQYFDMATLLQQLGVTF